MDSVEIGLYVLLPSRVVSLPLTSLIRNSWLDKTFPDRQNLFLPEASLPVDLESEEYQQAVKRYKESEEGTPFSTFSSLPLLLFLLPAFYRSSRPRCLPACPFFSGDLPLPFFSCLLTNPSEAVLAAEMRKDNFPAAKLIFALYAPRITELFDNETKAYWTSDERLGKGVYARLAAQTPEDDGSFFSFRFLRSFLSELIWFPARSQDHRLSQAIPRRPRFKAASGRSPFPFLRDEARSEGVSFLLSPPSPPHAAHPSLVQDFSVYGSYRLIRSVSAKLAVETFGAVPAWAEWLERIQELYPVKFFEERDSKE